MKGNPEERAVLLGEYIACTGATVRAAADRFGISKSTVHKDVTTRLRHLDPENAICGAEPLPAKNMHTHPERRL